MLVLRVPGLAVPAGRPVLRFSADEMETNNLPGLRVWLSPEARLQPAGDGEGFRDRRSRIDCIDHGDTNYTLNAAINGKPTATFARASSQGLNFPSGVVRKFDFLATAYTIAVVVKRTEASIALPLFSAASNLFGVQWRADNTFEMRHGTAAGLSGNTSGYTLTDTTGAHVILATWDAVNRVPVLEVDGVARTLTVASLVPPDLSLVASYGVGSAPGVAVGANSSFGDVLWFDRNYNLTQNLQLKRDLYRLLKAKYGLTF